jgi:hypothetical protein
MLGVVEWAVHYMGWWSGVGGHEMSGGARTSTGASGAVMQSVWIGACGQMR